MENFTKEIATANKIKDEANKHIKENYFEDAKNSYIIARQII